MTTEPEDICSLLLEEDMFRAGPEPVGLGVGLGLAVGVGLAAAVAGGVWVAFGAGAGVGLGSGGLTAGGQASVRSSGSGVPLVPGVPLLV